MKSKSVIKKSLSIFLGLVVSTALFSCSNSVKNEPTIDVTKETIKEKAETIEESIDRKSGTPWIDSELEGALDSSSNYSLKDDFAANVNKDYVLNAKYRPGYNIESPLVDIEFLTTERMNEILVDTSETESRDELAIRKLYNLWIDFDKRNSLGVSEIMPYIKELDNINDINSLNAYLKEDTKGRPNLNKLFTFEVDSDLNDSTNYLIYLGATDLLLYDSAEYIKLTDLGKKKKEAYISIIKYILKRLNYSDEEIETKIKNTFDFETEIAKEIKTLDERRAPEHLDYNNHTISVEEMKKLEGNIPIVEHIIARGINEDAFKKINIDDHLWLEHMKKIYVDSNVRNMCDAMQCHFALYCAPILDEETLNVYDEGNKLISGIDDTSSRESRATEFVYNKLPWPLIKAYCLKYFTKEDKDAIYNLTLDTISEYKNVLDEAEFLSDKTKEYAKEKIDNMVIHSLYPDDDEWPDSSILTNEILNDCDSLIDALIITNSDYTKNELEKIGKKTDRKEWSKSIRALEDNAFNSPRKNSIYICAGFCQGIMYKHGMSIEDLYGAIGVVIGHEISHAFDVTGSQYDKNGNFDNWWDEEDYNKFSTKVKKIENYYNNISPWKGEHVHGNIVTGEAIADMGGIKVMLNLAKRIAGFDYDAFFRKYASVWQEKVTLEKEQSRFTSVHPFRYLRINAVLQQFEEFFKTYDIKEGDKMYLKEEDRIKIW